MSVLSDYKDQVARGRRYLFQEKDSWWWGRPVGDYFAQEADGVYELTLDGLRGRAPSLFAPAFSVKDVKAGLLSEVDGYFKLNIFKKIWWRITRPMGLYIQLYTAITLNKMESALNQRDMLTSARIYQASLLPQWLSLWDRLWRGWRSVLDRFHQKNSSVFSGPSSSPQIMTSSLVLYSAGQANALRQEDHYRASSMSAPLYEAYQKERQGLDAVLAKEQVDFSEITQAYEGLIQKAYAYLQQVHQQAAPSDYFAEKDSLLLELKAIWRRLFLKTHPDRQGNHGQEEVAKVASQKMSAFRDELENRLDKMMDVSDLAASTAPFMSADLHDLMTSYRQFYTEVIEKRALIQRAAIYRNTVKIDNLRAEVVEKQAATDKELANTKGELANTKGELANTKGELADTKNEVAELKAMFLAFKAQQDKKSSSEKPDDKSQDKSEGSERPRPGFRH